MQVNQVNDHVTHAVIGGGQTIDFGISSSAEFFNILSSTLYKDQILAVVRETLCNAWDAHIEAGVTHTPVEITLTGDKFIIRDFGKGIHKDDMGPIYGTYGNSTKKNDGMQTGGFGLGCKAPFAYTDHFEVISSHDGVRTIYNLSKSSAQAQGKPGIVPIASFPTEETGLQVSIRIQGKDISRFKSLIQRIASNGDMNMKLNGDLIVPLGFDLSKGNYLLTKDPVLDTPTLVMVRYGNVVYPIDQVEAISHPYQRIVEHLSKLDRSSHRYNPYRLILQAPPHSISVTPSRESLSMQEHTTKTLNSLMKGFLLTLNRDFQPECDAFAKKVVVEAVLKEAVSELLNRENALPSVVVPDLAATVPNEDISDLSSMARVYMRSNYPSDVAFRKKDITFRLTKMADAGLIDRGLVQTYLRELEDTTSLQAHRNSTTEWLQKHMIAPIMKKMYKQGIDHKRFYVMDSQDCRAPSSYDGRPPMMPAQHAAPRSIINALPYMRNIVAVSTSRTDIARKLQQNSEMRQHGVADGFFFYHASMNKGNLDMVKAFFDGLGMTVIDITERKERVARVPGMPVDAAPSRKPAKKGLAVLTSICSHGAVRINTRQALEPDANRIEDPEYVQLISVTKGNSTSSLGIWNQRDTINLVTLYGDKGGITNNTAAHVKWLKTGLPDAQEYFIKKICAYIQASPTIREAYSFKLDRVPASNDVDYPDRQLLELLYNNPFLSKEFGTCTGFTPEDGIFLDLWDTIKTATKRGFLQMYTGPEIAATAQYLHDIPVDPINSVLIAKVKGNPLIRMLDESRVRHIFGGNHTQTMPKVTPVMQAALGILKTVLDYK